MTIFTYDKSFEGLLTALFHAYNRRMFPDRLLADAEPLPLFYDEVFRVVTDTALADRVWRGTARLLLCKVFDSQGQCVFNLMDADVVEVSHLWKKVNNEATRVIQFVRFQKTADDIYFAATSPVYNVLPLTMDYFTDRFHDQTWLVYDAKRRYGFFYDGGTPQEVRFEGDDERLASGILPAGR